MASYLLISAWAFNTDDAYISLRYARHLAEGHGIVWNIGEYPPVEGYTNFLFVILGAGAIHFGLDPLLALKIFSSCSLGITCIALYRIARLWVGPVGATLPALILTSYTGMIFWTVSGLETAVYQMFVTWAVLVFIKSFGFRPLPMSKDADTSIKKVSPSYLAISGFLVFLASITRTEGPGIGLVLGVALITHVALTYARSLKAFCRSESQAVLRSGLKMSFALLLSFAIPFASYFQWRFNYFGRLFPNSVYCKALYQGSPFELIGPFLTLLVPFGILALVSLRRWIGVLDVRYLAIGLIVVFYIIILYGVDPIIGRFNRHFLTAFSLLLVPASVGIFEITKLMLKKLPAVFQECYILVIALGCIIVLAVPGAKNIRLLAENYSQRISTRETLGVWLNEQLSPEESYLIGDTGIVPFITHAGVIDAYCLNCPEATLPPINRSPAMFAEMIFTRMPELIVIHSEFVNVLQPHESYGVYPAIVTHPSFEEKYSHVKTFGNGRDRFNYWVFKRNDWQTQDRKDL
jgi:hypothetical protein